MFHLKALGVSDEAWRRLAVDGAAEILSVFRRGITIAPLNDHNGRPIFVSCPGEGLLPEHVVVTKKDCEAILAHGRPGDTVFFTKRHRFRMEMPSLSASAQTIDESLKLLEQFVPSNGMTGLNIPCGEVLDDAWEWSEVFRCDWDKLPSWETEERRSVLLQRLIGRGHGSTPAGDDMLVGAMAYIAVNEKALAHKTFFNTIRALESKFPVLTTSTSEVYLHWALHRVFSSDIIRLMEGIMSGDRRKIERNIDALLRHGATSGLDTLVGIILIIRNSQKYCLNVLFGQRSLLSL
ncbi:DUF2877 domain-containing protein [Microvirga sp. W0021]|uniref:DUF2877 domain-containing protein n=1 Tax=Hohaiivirga grylli TaxID=3133970 RepID=A0ABV0BG34_9HYPH